MALWMVRAGKHGEQEQIALEKGFVTIGWDALSDLTSVKSKEDLIELYKRVYPNDSPSRINNIVGQIWTFLDRIQTNDLVILPLKTRSAIAVGRIVEPYRYTQEIGPDVRHIRKVVEVTASLDNQK